jgi:hypothetical protein
VTLKVRFRKEEGLEVLLLRDPKSYRWPRLGPSRLEIVRADGGRLSYPAHAIVSVEEV